MFISTNCQKKRNMYTEILKFDWIFFARKKSFLLLLLFFLSFGIFTAVAANFPFPETYKNAPYIVTYVIGVMSLINIFTVSLLAAQGLLRERDSQFDGILYATPIRKRDYLSSRFITIFGITALTFALYVIGLFIGHQLFRDHPGEYMNTGIGTYVYAFVVLALPNILFCTGAICSIGVLTKNKILIYISGLFIYFLYWGIAMFANSPLLANASPVSDKTMKIMARIDPFGLSAFFEQTLYWSALQRNQELIGLKGDFLWNRLLFLTIAIAMVCWAYRHFSFGVGKQKAEKVKNSDITKGNIPYRSVPTVIKGWCYSITTWFSLVKMDLKAVFKTGPIWIMLAGWSFFLAMEIAGNINAGVRLPERFATTDLMVTDILKLFPVIGLLIVLFYGSEIYWRSHSCRFDALEKTCPVSNSTVLLSKWTVLLLVPLLLIAASILTGVVFQWIHRDAPIDWSLYIALFYLIGWPLMLCAAFVICIQSVSPNRYMGLVISSLVLLLTNTSLGGMFGLTHPLWRFANAYQGNYSEMSGFDLFLQGFHVKMLFWTSVVALLFTAMTGRFKNWKRQHYGIATLSLVVAIWSGYLMTTEIVVLKKDDRNNWKQEYETRYKKYETLLQPVITDVNVHVELFPEQNTYTVSGVYTLQNTSSKAIDSLLVYTNKDLEWSGLTIPNAKLLMKDAEYGHSWFRLDHSLQPGEKSQMNFRFRYAASPFTDFMRFNTILHNGTFIRISNFFPGFGYQSDNGIDDPKERKRRRMAPATLVKSLEEKATAVSAFINLEMTLGTASDQTAIGIGELQKTWQKNNRNYFQYRTEAPIPFRFAIASARYAIKKLKHKGIAIEVYYHPEHHKNIDHLINNAQLTLDYCQQNFSRYPYKTLRFAEIASFSKGFAGTAYPTSFFINETFGFRNKVEQNPEKDILNEMVSHELSHTWWGNATLDPEYQEGSKMLTETLAMYTELMLYKKVYGTKNILSRIQVHQDLYLSGRSFATEEPLYRAHPDKSYLCYDKGMVVMYQLEQLIGEKQINRALRSLLKQYAYPNRPPTAEDLIREFYNVSDPATHRKIDELFKMIIIYELEFRTINCRKNASGEYDLSVQISAIKYKEDGNGNRKVMVFEEPVAMAITDSDGTTKTVVVTPEQLKEYRLRCRQKPIAVELDPNRLLLETNVENNRKTIP